MRIARSRHRCGSNVDLFRLRTAANGPIIKAFVSTGGNLSLRSDVAGTQLDSGVALGSGWHAVELCSTVGTATSWDLYRDGARIKTWLTNTGTTPIGWVQIGDKRGQDLHDDPRPRPAGPGARRLSLSAEGSRGIE